MRIVKFLLGSEGNEREHGAI